ncbi:uncharacterized protein LOC110719320 [Chenopodium quinoa]|uniref:uncharacterized protein LOC110719320 n=1 Tax=Chenopodium quinoa TaxID=63459 RepID=UPI000B78C3D8|nr:uncharacterized protein LOC110719320 [Chenopodium quinoa]XP_021753910.1 uncharacterized protein LOC110719320 [Chenopodium quinoa]XP_021753911.1 uncharacterized protein LOC110719320 [Chenopodium quinoa]
MGITSMWRSSSTVTVWVMTRCCTTLRGFGGHKVLVRSDKELIKWIFKDTHPVVKRVSVNDKDLFGEAAQLTRMFVMHVQVATRFLFASPTSLLVCLLLDVFF